MILAETNNTSFNFGDLICQKQALFQNSNNQASINKYTFLNYLENVNEKIYLYVASSTIINIFLISLRIEYLSFKIYQVDSQIVDL
jgi:hypothetical protein